MLSARLLMATRGRVRIGSLPSKPLLRELDSAGFRRYLNLSGVDLQTVYPSLPSVPSRLFSLNDVFSYPSTHIKPIAQDYLRYSPEGQPLIFLQAVIALRTWLAEGQTVYVFCYRGEGRSPAVALAALRGYFQLPLNTAQELVQKLRPQARITAMTLAAAEWVNNETS